MENNTILCSISKNWGAKAPPAPPILPPMHPCQILQMWLSTH